MNDITDEQILSCMGNKQPARTSERHGAAIFEYRLFGLIDFARRVLALAAKPSERPAPAGQAVGEPGDMRQALSDLRYAVNARPSCQENLIARCRCLKCAMLRSYDLLASSQAEPAVKEGDKP
jgi:hypothetical protein